MVGEISGYTKAASGHVFFDLVEERDGKRRFRLYSGDADYHRTPGTDFEAIAEGCVAITALHVDWEHPNGEGRDAPF